MNDADLLCAVIEQLLDADSLVEFASTSRRDPHAAAADLSRSMPDPVVTVEYTVSASPFGVLASSPSGRTSAMSWERVSDALAGAGLEARSGELQELLTASPQRAAEIRADLARRATLAIRLAAPTEQSLVFDGNTVALTTAGDTATMTMNTVPVVSVTPWENVPVVNVVALPPPGVGPFDRGATNVSERVRVQFVPPGFARPGRASRTADRVGLERLDVLDALAVGSPQRSVQAPGAKWALQVDGYDVAIFEAGSSRLRIAVYDNDPRRPFVAHESVRAVPGIGPGVGPPGGRQSPSQRLLSLCNRPSSAPSAGLDR